MSGVNLLQPVGGFVDPQNAGKSKSILERTRCRICLGRDGVRLRNVIGISEQSTLRNKRPTEKDARIRGCTPRARLGSPLDRAGHTLSFRRLVRAEGGTPPFGDEL